MRPQVSSLVAKLFDNFDLERNESRALACENSNYTFLTQKERDVETGLDYFIARYYGSSLGRFTSPDQPFLDQYGSDPQSWNLYTYVGNNPLKYVDPLGQWKREACQGATSQCWIWEPGDDYDTLAEQTGISADRLRWFFNKQTFGEGTVVDVAGVNAAYREMLETAAMNFYLENPHLTPGGAGGGLRVVGPLARGGGNLLSRFGSWIGRRLGFGKKAAEFAGGVTREALEAAAADTGPGVQVVTKLTQAPLPGRALSVAVGEGAEALANSARGQGQVFTARIPKALIERLRDAGLVKESVTQMGGARATEYRFEPEAMEFILRYFK
jgi:RHS repeat-associated protein